MVVICSMETLIKDGKLIREAQNAIVAMGKNDKLIIVSKTGNITVNTETLNFLTHINCAIEVSEYANEATLILNIGMFLAKADRLKIVMKAEDAVRLKELLKGNEKVSFGWTEGKIRKKVEPASENAEKKMKKGKSAEDSVDQHTKTPSAEEKPEKKARKPREKKETAKTVSGKTGLKVEVSLEDVKKAMGGRYSKKDLESITAVINEATDSELGLDFLLKIKVPVLYQKDETLGEKVKEAYIKLRR